LHTVINVFHIVFSVEGDYYSKQLYVMCHCNGNVQCLVGGRYGTLLNIIKAA